MFHYYVIKSVDVPSDMQQSLFPNKDNSSKLSPSLHNKKEGIKLITNI